MLVLFETAVGFAVFKVSDESKLSKVDNLYKEFESAKKANKLLSLKHFERYRDTTEAVSSVTALIEGKMGKKLKKMLKKVVVKENEELAVSDAKLGNAIKDKLNIGCVTSSAIQELMTCIRSQIDNLIPEWSPEDEAAMQLGLSHGIGRYKLKFSPDKVDTMIIQAVCETFSNTFFISFSFNSSSEALLDDLDKELNNYVMRSKEWYGWHFPELSKIVSDNTAYIRTVLAIGMRTNATNTDLSDILPEEVETKVKEMAEVSMGTEIAEEDMLNINHLCRNVLELQEYRSQLFEYLKNRMMAIAPNLTILVGELVGARLISHAGSLLNLAKHPASTVQILGAEKALFRALKTRHDTPKYGLLYHAQLVGQSNPKLKGKMSRMLAAKASLATRVDALGEETSNELGTEHRAKLEARLKFLEESGIRAISGSGKRRAKVEKYDNKSQIHTYKAAADSTITQSQKRKFDEPEEDIETKVKSEELEETPKPPKKKKKKSKQEKTEVEEPVEEGEEEVIETSPKKGKKHKKSKAVAEETEEVPEEVDEEEETNSSKKKKKKKKN